jgi:hypothetical protein
MINGKNIKPSSHAASWLYQRFFVGGEKKSAQDGSARCVDSRGM